MEINWIETLQGVALFYAIVGASTVPLAWLALLHRGRGSGWFAFRRCTFNARQRRYGDRSLLKLWACELFAVTVATLSFFALWPLILPAILHKRGQ